MIVGEQFQGDSIRIANIQHDLYDQAFRKIINFAIEKHCEAEQVINVRSDISDKRDSLREKGIDHRTLQWLHDSIAGAFRFNYCLNADLFDDLNASFAGMDVGQRWLQFLDAELKRLFEQYRQMPRWILEASIYANPDPIGIDAEERLYNMTRHVYPDLR